METWNIKQTEEFQVWFEKSDNALQDDVVEHIEILKQFGPLLGRPLADTLKGSSISNLKELRFGSGDKKFYLQMIGESEKIYANYLAERRKAIEEEKKISKRKRK